MFSLEQDKKYEFIYKVEIDYVDIKFNADMRDDIYVAIKKLSVWDNAEDVLESS